MTIFFLLEHGGHVWECAGCTVRCGREPIVAFARCIGAMRDRAVGCDGRDLTGQGFILAALCIDLIKGGHAY